MFLGKFKLTIILIYEKTFSLSPKLNYQIEKVLIMKLKIELYVGTRYLIYLVKSRVLLMIYPKMKPGRKRPSLPRIWVRVQLKQERA